MAVELQQSPVVFDKAEHRYFLDGKELQGITGTLIHLAFPSTYEGIPEETLQRAAERGTRVHKGIEDYEAGDWSLDGLSDEVANYVRMKEEHGLTHIASEYIVSDEEQFASAIDHVFMNDAGKIVIADVKTTYEPHYENVALQLSIYKRLFERQNEGLKVGKMALMWLRGEKSEYRELQTWADEALDLLIDSYVSGTAFDIQKTYGDLPAKFAEAEAEVARLEIAVKAAQDRQKELRQGLYELMEQHNVKQWTGSRVKLTRVLPTESEAFDSKKFKSENPELYSEYTKKVHKSGSLRVTLI